MRRVAELDALRGIASFVILMFHLRFVHRYPLMGTAVDLFFVLSGYLITSILLKGDRSFGSLKTFYVRRALRIWPIYYLTLIVFLLVNFVFARGMPTAGWPYYFTYLQFIPYYWGKPTLDFSRVLNHTWTLAIEEQFYIIWPLLVCLIGRKGVILAAIPLFLGSLFLRLAGLPHFLLLSRIDGLALGALLAALLADRQALDRHRDSYRNTFALLGSLLIVLPLVLPLMFGDLPLTAILQRVWTRLDPGETQFAFTIAWLSLIYFCIVGLVVLSAGHPRLAFLRTRWLCNVGVISYGLYLYHPIIFRLTHQLRLSLGFHGSAWYDAFRVACCFALAIFSWRYVERPLLNLRDRLTEGRGAVPAQEPRGRFGWRLRGPHSGGGGLMDSRDIVDASGLQHGE